MGVGPDDQERLRLALLANDLGIWDWDLRTGRVRWSERHRTICGFSPEPAEGDVASFLALAHPDDRAGLEAAVAHARETGEDYRYRYRIRRAGDGVTRWVEGRGRFFLDQAGAAVAATGTLRDVTDEVERSIAEQALAKEKELVEAILTHVPIMITFFDANGRFLFMNRACEVTLGWTREDWSGADLMERVFPDAKMRADALAFMNEADGKSWRTFATQVKAGRVVPTSWCNVRLPDGRLIGIGKDVTVEERLAQAQKDESLGVLAGGVAHDFNNLLTGILGNASLLAADLEPGTSAADIVGEIETCAVRAADLTRQLLAYAGKGRFVIEPLDLGTLVRRMSALITSAVSKKAAIRLDVTERLPLVRGDAAQLRQAVLNLVLNASDALGDQSGVITVRVGQVEIDALDAVATVAGNVAPGRYVFVEVSDTGCGISDEVRPRVFEPFFSTKFTGRGLGLAAVLGIVKAHGGGVTIVTEVGKGSSFRLFFAAVDDAPARAAEEAASRTQPARGAGTMLVVDDEPAVLRVVARLLEQEGYRVLVANDGIEGLELYDQHRAAIRAVLLDVTMPRLGGRETLAALRARDPNVRVILMTGHDSQGARMRLDASDASAVLRKPFVRHDLVDALASLLRGE